MPAVDWSQVVTIAWGVFIGLVAFLAIVGSFGLAVWLGYGVMDTQEAVTAITFGGFAWAIALPVALILGSVLVALAYLIWFSAQALAAIAGG